MSEIETFKQSNLALIAENEKLQNKWVSFANLCAQATEAHDNLLGENVQLKAEVEALRKDAERYRWLEKACKDEPMGKSNEYFTEYRRKYSLPLLISQSAVCSPISLREAIDAAMTKEQG